jgi:bifunctional N-acetylglucosamine-1-phosphate-uridyltransferase/glucosamine-1-phosphate-acetyltransferase GlmU-like protein
VLYGDVPFVKASSLKKLMDLHYSQHAKVSMFTSHIPGFTGKYKPFESFGRIMRDRYGNIVKIKEFADAVPEERKIREVNPGIYLFNTSWLWNNIDQINNRNALHEFYLTDIVEVAIASGETIHSLSINFREVFGINTWSQLTYADKLLS